MLVLMKTEVWKLKRYHMIWAGVLLMLLSVLLTVFSTTALDGTVWTFSFFVEQVMKNNITTIFPMCIALITGYIISREGTDDTLKNILTVPLSFPALLFGKLTVCGLLSLFLGMVSTIFTVAAALLLGFPGGDLPAILQAAAQITLNCLFLYIAVLPVIAIVYLSFVETKSIMTMIFPRGFTLENYLVIVEKGRVLKPIINSVKMSVMAVAAGADMLLMPEDFVAAYEGVLNAVQRGELTQERIDESVRRILKVKLEMADML